MVLVGVHVCKWVGVYVCTDVSLPVATSLARTHTFALHVCMCMYVCTYARIHTNTQSHTHNHTPTQLGTMGASESKGVMGDCCGSRKGGHSHKSASY